MTKLSTNRLLAARRRFFDDGATPRGLVSDTILRSWQRCAGLGLSESAAPEIEPLTQQRLREVCQMHEALHRLCLPELKALYADARATGSIVILTSPEGLILEALGSADFLDKASRVALRPGVPWSESTTGTNAIGTAVIEGRAVEVRGSEHFFAPHRVLSCSAVPIIDPFGRIAGVLDMSGEASIHHVHALGMIRMAADQIEHRLFDRTFPGCALLRLHSDAGLLGTVHEGIVVFDGARLVAANRHGLALLSLVRGDIGRRSFDELFDAPLGDIERAKVLRNARGQPLTIRHEARGHDRGAHSEIKIRPAATAPVSVGRQLEEAVFDAAQERELDRARRVLAAGMPVLLQGETGTGKEVFARELHRRYAEATTPFIAINCAGLPEALIESELFGYAEGAFTGARRNGSRGLLRAADGGILFLDEIGDMPLALQARLLRVLQEREVTPLGSSKPVKVDVAVISATHRDLAEAVAANRFRADLYFRLAHYAIRLPALREYPDRAALIDRLWTHAAAGLAVRMDEDVRRALVAYAWPGNLRQLSGTLRTLAALADIGGRVQLQDLPAALREQNGNAVPAPDAPTLAGITEQAMRAAIEESKGNLAAAARRLGISRSTLYRRLS